MNYSGISEVALKEALLPSKHDPKSAYLPLSSSCLNGEDFCLVFDADPDGIASAILMYRTLQNLGGKIASMMPITMVPRRTDAGKLLKMGYDEVKSRTIEAKPVHIVVMDLIPDFESIKNILCENDDVTVTVIDHHPDSLEIARKLEEESHGTRIQDRYRLVFGDESNCAAMMTMFILNRVLAVSNVTLEYQHRFDQYWKYVKYINQIDSWLIDSSNIQDPYDPAIVLDTKIRYMIDTMPMAEVMKEVFRLFLLIESSIVLCEVFPRISASSDNSNNKPDEGIQPVIRKIADEMKPYRCISSEVKEFLEKPGAVKITTISKVEGRDNSMYRVSNLEDSGERMAVEKQLCDAVYNSPAADSLYVFAEVSAPYYLANYLGHVLLEELNIHAVVIVPPDGSGRISLRSKNDRDIDLRKFSSYLGGGGHKNSAGFRLTDEVKKLIHPNGHFPEDTVFTPISFIGVSANNE